MKNKSLLLLGTMSLFLCACTQTAVNNSVTRVSPTPLPSVSPAAPATPIATASSPARPKDADYPGKGKVTKIDLELGSVEMDHEEIPGLMPPMRMEFYVSDKKMLDGLKVGDPVDFVIRYKGGTETVVKINKSK